MQCILSDDQSSHMIISGGEGLKESKCEFADPAASYIWFSSAQANGSE